MDYISRIDTERVRKKLSVLQLSIVAGLSEAAVKNILSRRSANPNIDSIIAICDSLKLSVAWVFTEDGENVVKVDTQDAKLLELIRHLPADARAIILPLIKYIAQ
ncbi:hypothetical protein FACS1894211_14490 [Clostridia bacterium]|nr:hypothetical protein FACS1894211_14490 [Clostridia bacterium]